MKNPFIFDLSFQELINILGQWGEPVYRAKQIWRGLYQTLWDVPEEFLNLPNALREKMAAQIAWKVLTPVAELRSQDGETEKTLFRLRDGNEIETVLMRYKERRTICISTQSGCAMGCVFCATGQMGFKRNLTTGEIVAQVLYFARLLKSKGEVVTNVVVMGMGEPFHNYDNTLLAVDRLNDPNGFNLGARRFTISTVGLVPMIRRFAEEKRQVNLAISLHSANDSQRSALLPINKKYTISDVIAACRYYVEKTSRRITFEWALIRNVNDTPEVANELVQLLKGLMCHVNVIPLNPTQKYPGQATTRERAQEFSDILNQAGIPCTIRIRRGIDIQAGCGQLASRAAKEIGQE